MSYFDMINFEESALLEGEQADAYKAKKAAEKKLNVKKKKSVNPTI